MGHKYKLRYRWEPEAGEFSKDDCTEGRGGTDAAILFSLLYPEDGSFSMNFWTWDGRAAKDGRIPVLDDKELFKVWALLSQRLANSQTLDEGRKEFAETAWEVFRAGVFGGKG